jgi:transposase InsO family protein
LIGRLRDELLNETLFAFRAWAREALMIWKNDYNLVRPHSAIGNLAPSIYAELSAPGMQRNARERMEDWRKYYNEERPHGAIGNKPPSCC